MQKYEKKSYLSNNQIEKTADGVKATYNGQVQKNSDYQTESDAANQKNMTTVDSQKQNMESLCPVTCKKYNYRSEESTLPEVKKVQGNKTERSYTEPNKKEEGEAAPRSWKTMVQEQLEYDWLLESYPHDQSAIKTMVTIIADAMSSADDAVVKVGGRERRMDDVKEQLLQLDSGHIEYVLEYLQCNTSKVQNVYSYLLTILYNAPLTMDLYYEKLVRHDQAKKRR